MTLAPAENRSASAPIDERGLSRGLREPRMHHLDRVAADRVHLRVELDGDDAVAEIDEARASVFLHDAARGLG